MTEEGNSERFWKKPDLQSMNINEEQQKRCLEIVQMVYLYFMKLYEDNEEDFKKAIKQKLGNKANLINVQVRLHGAIREIEISLQVNLAQESKTVKFYFAKSSTPPEVIVDRRKKMHKKGKEKQGKNANQEKNIPQETAYQSVLTISDSRDFTKQMYAIWCNDHKSERSEIKLQIPRRSIISNTILDYAERVYKLPFLGLRHDKGHKEDKNILLEKLDQDLANTIISDFDQILESLGISEAKC
ncbi:MAG: hypothetical protein NZM26_03610 [Patescibacteria group bacterium]|nr:hypothetical protein [Patescibacteria group bacterium]